MKRFRGMMRGRHLVAVYGVAVASIALSQAAQQPTFSAKVDAVRVDVSVTDRGRIVRGLTLEDFEVRDNGVLQQVDLTSFEQLPLNVHLVLDLSHSVSGERLNDVKTAGRALLDGLTARDKASLLTFNHVVSSQEALTPDLRRLRAALDGALPSGDTALYDATYAGMLLSSGSDAGRDLMLVFSDGHDTASWLSSETVLQSARRSDVVVYGLSVRGAQSGRFLTALGAATGGDAFEIDATRNLQGRFVRILEEFRQRYLVSYSPKGIARGGWHKLEVKVKGRAMMVRARPGYFDREELGIRN